MIITFSRNSNLSNYFRNLSSSFRNTEIKRKRIIPKTVNSRDRLIGEDGVGWKSGGRSKDPRRRHSSRNLDRGRDRLRGWKSNYWTLFFLPFPLFRVSCNRRDTATVSFPLSRPVRRSFLFVASALDSLPDPRTRREANYRGIKEQFPSLRPTCTRPDVCTMEMGRVGIVKNLQGKTKVWPFIFPFSKTANRTCLELFPVTVRLTGLPPPPFKGVQESVQIPTMADNGFQPFFSPFSKNNIEKKGRKKNRIK